MLNMCSCMYSLMWLQLFNFVCVHSAYIPSPHGRPRFYHFGTLDLFLCMRLLCVEYQTGLHSLALRTGYDGLRRFYGIPTLPTLCDPFSSHAGAIVMCGHT